MTGRRGNKGVGEALIEIDFAVAVEIDEPGYLVAAKHINCFVGNDETQGMVQAGGDASPANALEFLVQPFNAPHISFHRAQEGRSIRKEVMAAKEEQCLPGILERRRNRVHSI